MNRYPPAAVIKELRQESNFKCSIPNCNIPYLEYHHFLPPWYIKAHHDPKGMIALCPIHHRKADVGAWTDEQLLEFKNINKKGDIAGDFEYLRRKILLELGGNYFFNNQEAEIYLANKPLVWFELDERGYKMLNIRLFDALGKVYFHIENNSWKIKDAVKDVECPPNGRMLKVFFKNGNHIKLEFKEFKDYQKLQSAIDFNILRYVGDEIPFTLLKVSLKLNEFKVNFSTNKTSLGNKNVMMGCFSANNRIGLYIGS